MISPLGPNIHTCNVFLNHVHNSPQIRADGVCLWPVASNGDAWAAWCADPPSTGWADVEVDAKGGISDADMWVVAPSPWWVEVEAKGWICDADMWVVAPST